MLRTKNTFASAAHWGVRNEGSEVVAVAPRVILTVEVAVEEGSDTGSHICEVTVVIKALYELLEVNSAEEIRGRPRWYWLQQSQAELEMQPFDPEDIETLGIKVRQGLNRSLTRQTSKVGIKMQPVSPILTTVKLLWRC